MKPVAEVMAEIGWSTRLSELSELADADRVRGRRLPGRHARDGAPRLHGDSLVTDASLDFNHRTKAPGFADGLNALVDCALEAENEARPVRDYLGASRLGDPCARRLQYEYLNMSRDTGAGFTGKTLRTFALGHSLEDLAVEWLRKAGLDLRTRNRNGEQFGFAVAGNRVQGHIDGVVVAAEGMSVPALWECKTANAKNWREMVRRGVVVAKPVYAAQIALYQAYAGLTEAPALLTAINKDTSELWHELVPFDGALAQSVSDKAVRILEACDVGEWLPRVAQEPVYFECTNCAWKQRCWA
jgi:hypothetical protein